MTWFFDPSGDTMDVYDHEGTGVAIDRTIAYDNNGDPKGSWSGDFPDEVLTVMDEAAVAEFQANGVSLYALQCLRHGAFELIEEGTPPS